MSDPVVNIEIEDVLASIRRLVSEGETPKAGGRPNSADMTPTPRPLAGPSAPTVAPETSANISSAPEKLVLSPEQLIEIPRSKPIEPLVLGTPLSSPAEDESSVGGDVADSFVEPAALGAWAEVDPSQTDLDTADDTETEIASAAPGDSTSQEPVAAGTAPKLEVVNNDARAQLLSTIEELEAAVTETQDDFEPDGSEHSPVVDWAKTTASGAIFGARASTTRVADVASQGGHAVEGEGTSAALSSRKETLAEVRRLAQQEIDKATSSTLDDELEDFIAADRAVDQAELRSMVVDIVREELQGALGERITRNVRKLVRREIHRILASDDFN